MIRRKLREEQKKSAQSAKSAREHLTQKRSTDIKIKINQKNLPDLR
jgi:hypothetical protein